MKNESLGAEASQSKIEAREHKAGRSDPGLRQAGLTPFPQRRRDCVPFDWAQGRRGDSSQGEHRLFRTNPANSQCISWDWASRQTGWGNSFVSHREAWLEACVNAFASAIICDAVTAVAASREAKPC